MRLLCLLFTFILHDGKKKKNFFDQGVINKYKSSKRRSSNHRRHPKDNFIEPQKTLTRKIKINCFIHFTYNFDFIKMFNSILIRAFRIYGMILYIEHEIYGSILNNTDQININIVP